MFSRHIVPILLLNNNKTLYFLPPQGSYNSCGLQSPSSSCICLQLWSSMSSSLSRLFQTLSHFVFQHRSFCIVHLLQLVCNDSHWRFYPARNNDHYRPPKTNHQDHHHCFVQNPREWICRRKHSHHTQAHEDLQSAALYPYDIHLLQGVQLLMSKPWLQLALKEVFQFLWSGNILLQWHR